MVRAFLGMALSHQEQDLLKQIISNSSLSTLSNEIRWVPPENWHITLRFLGNVTHETIDYMSQCAKSAAAEITTFVYQAAKIAGFPAAKSRMVAVYIEPQAILEQLFQTLDQAAVAAGLNSENYRFKPHITLAKSHHQIKAFSSIVLEDLYFTAKELVLYESRPSPEGSHYIPLKKFAFR